jgi:hypothetical protein
MLWSWNRVLPVVKWTFQWSVVLPVFFLTDMFQACSFLFLWLLLLPVCATSCEVDIPWISRTPSFFTRYVPSLFVFISVITIVAGVCYQWWSGHSVNQSYSQFLFYQICSKLVRFYFCGYYCCRCVLPVVKWTFRESVVLPVFFLPDMFQACWFLFLWLLLLLVCATSGEVDIPWISRTPRFFFIRYVPSLFVFISVVIIVAGVCYRLWSGHSVNQSYSQFFFY